MDKNKIILVAPSEEKIISAQIQQILSERNMKDKIEIVPIDDIDKKKRFENIDEIRSLKNVFMINSFQPLKPYGETKKSDIDKLQEIGIHTIKDLQEEYQLIQNKESDRSSNIRKIIVELYNMSNDK